MVCYVRMKKEQFLIYPFYVQFLIFEGFVSDQSPVMIVRLHFQWDSVSLNQSQSPLPRSVFDKKGSSVYYRSSGPRRSWEVGDETDRDGRPYTIGVEGDERQYDRQYDRRPTEEQTGTGVLRDEQG